MFLTLSPNINGDKFVMKDGPVIWGEQANAESKATLLLSSNNFELNLSEDLYDGDLLLSYNVKGSLSVGQVATITQCTYFEDVMVYEVFGERTEYIFEVKPADVPKIEFEAKIVEDRENSVPAKVEGKIFVPKDFLYLKLEKEADALVCKWRRFHRKWSLPGSQGADFLDMSGLEQAIYFKEVK
jgi:hypothetical protein